MMGTLKLTPTVSRNARFKLIPFYYLRRAHLIPDAYKACYPVLHRHADDAAFCDGMVLLDLHVTLCSCITRHLRAPRRSSECTPQLCLLQRGPKGDGQIYAFGTYTCPLNSC
ncbi:hypothetical protein NDU88_002067 [Pleurodeles waltl]|uniref:Uncharacterized protein n=1 Tax=Pleurodeles waltl TaxID=8319 RepID=A0AAV7MQJ8_PLEWA|nr:hypothetical protein NDU88_002067 [Pleurodeles waltl]